MLLGSFLPRPNVTDPATRQRRRKPIRDGRLNIADAHDSRSPAPDSIMKRRKLLPNVKASFLKRDRQAVHSSPRRSLIGPVVRRHRNPFPSLRLCPESSRQVTVR
ncbi:hypothetical protein [Paractinoplanes hotanensis]|uniref:Uncharacterized protein n=1 Tax=Paractinoplanes hotanensis TaxID=2906497 RepID=A0ABT0YGF4_9ACTN|nr:hypothetical protein [Actinoplanes hotanensis]MCM4085152.1 hypothetical protein [Actinoplanes hotanensis]